MGWAKENMSAADRERIARSLFAVDDKISNNIWLRGSCPSHKDEHPSFGYNIEEDYFKCFSCGITGDEVALFCLVHGLDPVEGFRRFIKLVGSPSPLSGDSVQGKGRKRGGGGKNKAKKPAPVIDEETWGLLPPLTNKWVERLGRERGWSPEIIKALDLRLQTNYRRKKDGKSCKVLGTPDRVAIPIRDKDGKLRNIRLYKPGAKKMKIISWGTAFGVARLFPPAPTVDSNPIILCEGESDTVCALSQGLNAITQTSKTSRWPKEHLAPFKDRDVVITYDADQAGQQHAKNAASSLYGVAHKVSLLEWSDYMGRQADGSWPKDHGQDLTDFFVTHGKSKDDFEALVQAAKIFEPPPSEDGDNGDDQPLGSVRRFFARGPGGRLSFKPRLVADQIMKDVPLLNDDHTGLLYKWNGRYWEEYSSDQVKRLALDYLGREGNKSRAEDACFQARMLSTIPHGCKINDRPEWVCVKNGMLHLTECMRPDYKLSAHERDYYATYELGVEYNPESTMRCTRWLRFLEETIQTQGPIMQAQEFAGYCLTRYTHFHKFLILIGPGSDGKSVFLKILQQLVGEQNHTAVAFQDLEDQFHRSSLYGKLLNVSTEVGSKALESNIVKAITTGDTINAAFKHKDNFDFKPYCKMAFAANRLPRVLDNSDGFFRRPLPISFKRQFFDDDDDTNLLRELEGELSEIFVWALAGLQRLIAQEGFTRCDETDTLLMKWRRLNNPVLCFLEDHCEIGRDYTAPSRDIYTVYKGFCGESGYSALSRENFFRELYATQSFLTACRPRINGSPTWSVRGLRLKPDAI